jgi:hypothetical protein
VGRSPTHHNAIKPGRQKHNVTQVTYTRQQLSKQKKMVKVLLFGVTGVIGREVARSFVRSGHEVYGVTRNEGKIKELLQEESMY